MYDKRNVLDRCKTGPEAPKHYCNGSITERTDIPPHPATLPATMQPQPEPPHPSGLTGPARQRMQERRMRGVRYAGAAFRRMSG